MFDESALVPATLLLPSECGTDISLPIQDDTECHRIFRYPYKMILNVIDRMRSLSVLLAHGSPPMSDYTTFLYLLKLLA